jgi:hypothetical protein
VIVWRYLSRNINLINLILVGVLGAVIFFLILPLTDVQVSLSLPKVKTKPAPALHGGVEVKQSPSPIDYVTVAENNPFHPERIVPVDKKDEKLVQRPELLLYGTIVSNGVTVAFIEDKKAPNTTVGRGKRQTVVKKGDVVGGFVVKEIASDRMVLVRGDDTMTVNLTDKGKERVATESGPGPKASPSPMSTPAKTPTVTTPSIPPVAPSATPSPVWNRRRVPDRPNTGVRPPVPQLDSGSSE